MKNPHSQQVQPRKGKTMTGNTPRNLALLCAALAVIPCFAGCATKGYVNKQVDQLRQADQTQFAELQNSTADALARAKTASGQADEARELALGKAGLEELNRYTVLFKFNSDKLEEDQTGTLDQAAGQITGHPEAIIDVYGFADPTGPDRYNLELGQRRANEVVRYLLGASPNQLSKFAAVSFGERDLQGMSAENEDHSSQRRVVVSLIRRIPLGQGTAPTAEAIPPQNIPGQ
jgi:peptidoglycan-associated lipoprotein